ncbi:MAG: MFS transporter, partial [Acidimicrobiia bacterium]
MNPISRTRVGVIALGTMAVATFPLAAYSVLAADLIDEFGILRSQVGLLITANSLVGALSSPFFGHLTDRVGAVQATRGTFIVAAATLVGMALAPAYGVLVLVALTAGLANGWGNPATNALIVENLPPGGRGVVTGIKQSGVQVGIFLAGLTLPALASLWDWRLAVALFVVVPLVGFAITSGLPRRDEVHRGGADGDSGGLPSSVKWLAVYGTISGMATSS